jgi:hypothetical protein
MKFIQESTYSGFKKIKLEMQEDSSLEEILVGLTCFLRACGYVIEQDKVLDFVDWDGL